MYLTRRTAPLFMLAFCTVSGPALQAQAPAQPKSDSPTAALLQQLGRTERVGDLALSPDGHRLAMEVDGALRVIALPATAASSMSGQPVKLCPGSAAGVSALSWSPDGATLAVLTHCEDRIEIVTTDGKPGSTGKVLATLHGYAKGLEYAPDGKSLGMLYVAGATRPSGALAAMKPPSGVIGVEGLEVQRVAVVSTAGAVTEVTPPNLHVYEFSFSPDAKKLAYIAAAPPGENNWWVAKLYTQARIAGAEPKVILDPNTVEGSLHGLQIAVPRWSPQGSEIALIGGLMSDQGATGGDLYELAADGSGAPVDRTQGLKGSVQWIDWLPDGKVIGTVIDGGSERIDTFTLPREEQGGQVIAQTAPADSKGERLPYSIGDGRLAGSFAVSRDGAVAAWVASSYAHAPEVYAGARNGSPLPAVTQVNAELKPSWGKAESIEWTNEGFPVQGWLLYPADYDPAKHYGLIVMVHGGPSSAVVPRWPYAGFGAAPLAASGYFVLEPNPRGSYGEGEAFTQANRKDFGYGDLRDILAGVDTVEKQIPAVDDHRLGLTGWSYGGFMTMFGVTQTHRFHAAVAGAGISDWLSYYGENSIDQWMTPFFGTSVYKDPAVYAKSSAIHFMDKVTTPTLIVVGDRDGECPAPQSFEFWHALKAFDVPTTLVVYPDEGHGFVNPDHRRDVLERSIAWFNKYLP
jgi:dipeptidyl aminopeptidase/acylaminoacyl peptidase